MSSTSQQKRKSTTKDWPVLFHNPRPRKVATLPLEGELSSSSLLARFKKNLEVASLSLKSLNRQWHAVSRIRVRTTGSCDPRPYFLRTPCYFAAWILRAAHLLSLAGVKTTDAARWYIFLHGVHASTWEITRGLPHLKLPLPGANFILGSIRSHFPPGATWSNNIRHTHKI